MGGGVAVEVGVAGGVGVRVDGVPVGVGVDVGGVPVVVCVGV